MRILSSTLCFFIFTISLSSQNKKTQDINAIKSMCGCFEVSFNFSETFNYSNDSLYLPSKNKIDKGLEWAQLVVDEKNEISIQHLLQVGNPSNPYIIKHWRQDWLYENQNLYDYQGGNKWTHTSKSKKEVKGQWTQKVYQVDDSPRYDGTGTWVFVDNKKYWESTTNAPLPRRELSIRNDYNILKRGNRHEITHDGWIHDQNNLKVINQNEEDEFVLAKEKGYNIYKKVDDSRCKGASDWWEKNKNKWFIVRSKWNNIYSQNQDLHLHYKVNNMTLYEHLFSDNYKNQKEISSLIESFLIQ
ncbi:MAG: hypothetical protein CMC04_06750 [Flavobacteriaceae bacterium]|mgnify:FL=1|nr:hypothetical protein [Flavobacteriaceae bacterium]